MTDGQAFSALVWPFRLAAISLMLIGIFWAFGVVVQSVFAFTHADHDVGQAALNEQVLIRQELAQAVAIPNTFIDAADVGMTAGTAVREVVITLMTATMRMVLNTPTLFHPPAGAAPEPPKPKDPGGQYLASWWQEHGDWVDLVL